MFFSILDRVRKDWNPFLLLFIFELYFQGFFFLFLFFISVSVSTVYSTEGRCQCKELDTSHYVDNGKSLVGPETALVQHKAGVFPIKGIIRLGWSMCIGTRRSAIHTWWEFEYVVYSTTNWKSITKSLPWFSGAKLFPLIRALASITVSTGLKQWQHWYINPSEGDLYYTSFSITKPCSNETGPG